MPTRAGSRAPGRAVRALDGIAQAQYSCCVDQLAFDFDASSAADQRAAATPVVPRPIARRAERIEKPAKPDPMEALRRARKISDALAEHLGEPVRLVVTDNKRLMLSARQHLGLFEIRVHHMFLDADAGVVRALALYLKRRDRRAGKIVDDFIAAHEHRIDKRRRRQPSVRARGAVHDLKAIYRGLVSLFDDDALEGVRIGWGRHGPLRRRRYSVQLGSYSREDLLIRIHPVLDQDWVPEWYVASVVFHEMLHHVIPAKKVGRTLRHHTPEFRRREAAYPHHAAALKWEERNLRRLLRSMSK